MTLTAHKIALKPTRRQTAYFRMACGVARFTYNWGLAEWNRLYAAGEKPSWTKVTKNLRAVQDEQFPWMREVTKLAPEVALQNLGNAFSRFFASLKPDYQGPRVGFPQFKKKSRCKSAFCAAITNSKTDSIQVRGRRVKLPRIGWVRMRQEVRFNGRIKRATVSCVAGRWFVTLLIDTHDIKPVPAKAKLPACGVDLGVKTLATICAGEDDYLEVPGPKPLRRLQGRLKRLNRQLHRRKLGSANRQKTKTALGRLHARSADVRGDALHKLTTRLAKGFQVVCIEDLNVSGMVANHCLARAVSDCGFGEFRRQATYKTAWHGTDLVVADRWFPSSKKCPECGAVNAGLTLGERQWVCPACGVTVERDRGAAKNLRDYAHPGGLRGQPVERSGAGVGGDPGANQPQRNRNRPVSTLDSG